MKNIARKIQTIDANGRTPGRLAAEIATLLIGKHKPDFQPNMDAGDAVSVVNAAKMRVTGKKMEQKKYYRHTEYGEGLKVTTMKSVWAASPAEVLKKAVSRMLPKNSHRDARMKRLVVKN